MNQETEPKKIRLITGFLHYKYSNIEIKCRFIGVRREEYIIIIPRNYYKRSVFSNLYNILSKSDPLIFSINNLGIQTLTMHYWKRFSVDQELYKSLFYK